MDAANDVKPLQPLTFLAAAIRAEVHDMRKRVPYVQVGAPECEDRLQRILRLLLEIERHGEGNPHEIR